MNRRQKMKRLKSQNRFMRNIIHNSADMERCYRLWTEGLNIKQTRIPIEEYKCERIIPPSFAHNDKYIEVESRLLVNDLLDELRDYVSIEIQDLGWEKVVHGSILVARK